MRELCILLVISFIFCKVTRSLDQFVFLLGILGFVSCPSEQPIRRRSSQCLCALERKILIRKYYMAETHTKHDSLSKFWRNLFMLHQILYGKSVLRPLVINEMEIGSEYVKRQRPLIIGRPFPRFRETALQTRSITADRFSIFLLSTPTKHSPLPTARPLLAPLQHIHQNLRRSIVYLFS